MHMIDFTLTPYHMSNTLRQYYLQWNGCTAYLADTHTALKNVIPESSMCETALQRSLDVLTPDLPMPDILDISTC